MFEYLEAFASWGRNISLLNQPANSLYSDVLYFPILNPYSLSKTELVHQLLTSLSMCQRCICDRSDLLLLRIPVFTNNLVCNKLRNLNEEMKIKFLNSTKAMEIHVVINALSSRKEALETAPFIWTVRELFILYSSYDFLATFRDYSSFLPVLNLRFTSFLISLKKMHDLY